LKPVKTVSFEDTNDVSSNSEAEENGHALEEKVSSKVVQIERQVETNGNRKPKKNINIRTAEVITREKRHHRSTDQTNLFGAEGKCENYLCKQQLNDFNFRHNSLHS
jgi:hypothetical protein